jgi:hypothetical protein
LVNKLSFTPWTLASDLNRHLQSGHPACHFCTVWFHSVLLQKSFN